MTRKNTSGSSRILGNRTFLYASGAALLGTAAATYFMMSRRGRQAGASSLDQLPANPTEDRFGNRGDENIVEPLTLREDQILMRDRMNPYNGLY